MPDAAANSAQHLSVLVQVARQMGKTFELDPLLETIEKASRSAMNCERAAVFLYHHDTDELVSRIATGTNEIRFPATQGIAGQAAQTRSVIVVADAYEDPRFNRDIDRQTGFRTRGLLTIPLITPDDEVIGVLQLLNKVDGSFTRDDEVLATALGSLTGIAIKRQMLLDEAAVKQRLEHDLDIARDIQRKLLPARNPEIDGFDIAGWNRPADQTGGDCYDFRLLDDNRLLFMIADATGHGIGPALIVAQCRAILRAVTDNARDLPAIAARVNDLLCEDLASGRFVTTCFGVLDQRTGGLDYLSAGQGPILLYRAATNQVEESAATSLPIGVISGTRQQLAEPVVLEPGDIFALLTDGFFEWAGPDEEQYGKNRFVKLLCENAHLSAAQIIETVHQDVRRFAQGKPQLDDLTAVVIKRSGQA